MGGIINGFNKEEELYLNLTKRLIEIENKITDYEMYSIIKSHGKFYANNFCDFLSILCYDFKIFENELIQKNFC
jgi:hypothetical protein